MSRAIVVLIRVLLAFRFVVLESPALGNAPEWSELLAASTASSGLHASAGVPPALRQDRSLLLPLSVIAGQ